MGLGLEARSSSTLSTPRVERVTACVAHRRGLARRGARLGLGVGEAWGKA